MKLHLLPTIVVKGFISSAFFLFSILFPVNKKKITFASYRADRLEGNLYFLYDELKSNHPDYKCRFLFKKMHGGFWSKLGYVFHMLKASYALATSRYFIIDDFYFPVYAINPRKGTEIIQLWHAAGAFKKFGFSTIGKSFGPSKEYLEVIKVHSNYSRVYVSSQFVIPFYAEAFDMEKDRIFPLGLPRTDIFYDSSNKIYAKSKFEKIFPELKKKKVILYAPTFRGSSHNQVPFNIPIDFHVLKEMLGDQYTFIINLHPYMKTDLQIDNSDEFVQLIHNELNIEELLMIADVLLTDYSSVIFDYSLLSRPIAFFVNDLEEYIQERDFYFEYTNFIPGPIFNNTQSLAEWLLQGDFDMDRVTQFRNKFFDYHDGKASKRIVEHLVTCKDLSS